MNTLEFNVSITNSVSLNSCAFTTKVDCIPGNLVWLHKHIGSMLMLQYDYGNCNIHIDLFSKTGKRMFTLAERKYIGLKGDNFQHETWYLTKDNYYIEHCVDHHYTFTKNITLTPTCLKVLSELALIAKEYMESRVVIQKEENIEYTIILK